MRNYLLLITLCLSCTQKSELKNLTPFNEIPAQIFASEATSYFVPNPYGNSPLTAELRIAQAPENLTITVKGIDGTNSDLSYTWYNSTNQVFPILGMYFQHTNTILISDGSQIKEITYFVNEKPSDLIKSIDVVVNNRPNNAERKNFLNFINPVAKLTDLFAFDNYGKIRWYLTSKHELHGMKFTHDDNYETTFTILDTVNPQLITYNMLGKKLSSIKGPEKNDYNVKEADKRFHHEFVPLENGNILVLDKSQYGVEDTIIEMTPKGKLVRTILIGDWIRKTINGNAKDNTGLEEFIFDSDNNPIDEYRSQVRYPGMPENQNAIDWAHINAMSFDPTTQTLVLSFRQHGIFAFDYKNESLKWIYLRPNNTMPRATLPFYNLPDNFKYAYQIPALAPYILEGAGPDHPHSITALSNNQYMVFDNSGNDGGNPEEGSRMLVFSVDEQNKTATNDWEYRHTQENGNLLYAQITSDIDKTPFNSYVGIFGTSDPFRFIEISDDKNIIFDMKFYITAKSAGDSAVALPIACPTTRLAQNGVFVYRGDYDSIYPSKYQSID